MVGRSGNCAERRSALSAMARTRPSLICVSTVDIGRMDQSMRPAMTSISASGEPL